ncbi:hypothetical protein NUW58_g3446 [Xylaria curta]|uniref:Uncharacterized protein n=1 Tax=Xylaria curta TaxID=42375 RepID=A0ACC1PC96_9PEZI|nr:hypothetical protein NUW58_g3446 [Xylaria curta]
MLSTRLRLLLAAAAVTATAELIQVPFNNRPGAHLSPDIDGPWPTIQLEYNGSQQNLNLNAYLTLSNVSLLVRPQKCADEVADGILRCDEFAFPEFYLNASITKQFRLPNITDSTQFPRDSFFTLWNDVSLTGRPGLDLRRFMPLDGNVTGINFISDLAGLRIETPAIVGEKLTTLASNNSRLVPVLNSIMSLPKIAASLSETGRVSSPFSSFHMGSVEPPVNGSLIVGGYDNNKIMGDLLNWTETYNSYGNPSSGAFTLTHIHIGVESGFLPLEKLRLNNGSFPQGPYKQEPRILHEDRNSTVERVIIEPGAPYLHLTRDACDPLAKLLDLEYDTTRNLYLWSYPPDHPIFRSPVYLELVLTPIVDFNFHNLDETAYSKVSIKIPMASLQHTFHATTRARDGSLLPPARYFPCSRREFEWLYGLRTWPRLGRAFLQSAFVASNFKYNDTEDTVANYWLAQAPGPAGIEGNTTQALTEVASGTMPNRTGVKLEANAWTKSWSSVLPIWTLDHDGVTTLDQLNATPESTQQANLGVKVAAPIVGTAVALLILFFGARGIHRSRVNNTRLKREISEEDATAREIERLSILDQREKLMPRASTEDGLTNRHSVSASSSSEGQSRVSGSEHISFLSTNEGSSLQEDQRGGLN